MGSATGFRRGSWSFSVVAQFQVTDPAQLLHCVDLSGGRVEGVHLAEVVARSSSGDCGATFPLGLIGGVAVGNVHLWRHLPPRVQF